MSQDEQQDPVEAIGQAVERIVRMAAELGYTLTIEQVSNFPPAIGNTRTRIDIRQSHHYYRWMENREQTEESPILLPDAPKIILPLH